jgi:hypothetical protein
VIVDAMPTYFVERYLPGRDGAWLESGLARLPNSTPTGRSGALHVTKECSQYNGTVESFCTITSSNINAIKPGMRVVYLQALGQDGSLDSDIVLSAEHGSAASGHVLLNSTASQVTFSGGTGKFAGFHANAVVSVNSAGVWHWDGTYSFTPSDD